MDGSMRMELTNDGVTAVNESLELDRELQAARDQLEHAISAEAFVAMRLERYANVLQTKRNELMPKPPEPEPKISSTYCNNVEDAITELDMRMIPPPDHGDGYMPATDVSVKDNHHDEDDDDDDSVLSEYKQQPQPALPYANDDKGKERQSQFDYWQRRLEREEAALATAAKHHATLVQNVSALRMTLHQLQRKKNAMDGNTQEVKDFIVAVAQVEGIEEEATAAAAAVMEHDDDYYDKNNANNDNNNNNNDMNDLEMQLCHVEEQVVNDVQKEQEERTAENDDDHDDDDDGVLIEQLETGNAGGNPEDGALAATTIRNDDDDDNDNDEDPTKKTISTTM